MLINKSTAKAITYHSNGMRIIGIITNEQTMEIATNNKNYLCIDDLLEKKFKTIKLKNTKYSIHNITINWLTRDSMLMYKYGNIIQHNNQNVITKYSKQNQFIPMISDIYNNISDLLQDIILYNTFKNIKNTKYYEINDNNIETKFFNDNDIEITLDNINKNDIFNKIKEIQYNKTVLQQYDYIIFEKFDTLANTINIDDCTLIKDEENVNFIKLISNKPIYAIDPLIYYINNYFN